MLTTNINLRYRFHSTAHADFNKYLRRKHGHSHSYGSTMQSQKQSAQPTKAACYNYAAAGTASPLVNSMRIKAKWRKPRQKKRKYKNNIKKRGAQRKLDASNIFDTGKPHGTSMFSPAKNIIFKQVYNRADNKPKEKNSFNSRNEYSKAFAASTGACPLYETAITLKAITMRPFSHMLPAQNGIKYDKSRHSHHYKRK